MLATSGAASVVLGGVTYAASVKVTMTLPGGVYPDQSIAVSNLTITSSKATDGPDQSTYQVGWPSASASFTLSGLVDKTDATRTAGWLFGRWQTTSPLYRQDALLTAVTIDIVLAIPGATEAIRKFTGFVSYYKRRGASVDVTCSDRSVVLRKSTAGIPAVATSPPFNAGLTAEFAVDAALRAASAGAISSWPKQRTQCVLAVGFRSSTWAEVGSLLSTWLQPVPVYATGAMGTALTSSPQISISTTTTTRWATASGVTAAVFLEFWAKAATATDTNAATAVYLLSDDLSEGLLVSVGSSNLVVWDQRGGTQATIAAPSDGLWHYYGVKCTLPAVGGSAVSGTAYIDGTPHAFSTTLGAARAVSSWTTAAVAVANLVVGAATIEALQVTTEASPTPSYPFTPQAVLDPSLNTLEVVPGIPAGTDPRALITTIAAAELAVAGFDESGIFRYVNRANWQQQTVARTVTAANLADIGEETTSASVVNHAQVGFSGWSQASVATVWSLTRGWKIPRRSVGRNAVIRYVLTSQVVTNVPASVAVYPNVGSPAAGTNYYAASLDSAGINAHPGLTITVAQVSPQRLKLTFVNATNQDAYLVSPAAVGGLAVGTPTLGLRGQPYTRDTESVADYQYPSEAEGGAASSRFGETLWQFTGSDWSQDADTAQQLTEDVVNNAYQPRPNLTDLQIVPPDPRIQNGDLLHVQDAVTTIVDDYVRVFGWELSVSPSGMTQTIDGKTLAPPGAWIGGLAGRSEAGTTTYATS